MGEVYHTSDDHFWHRMVAVDKRGFASVEEHNEALITYWNETVRPRDVVFNHGDFGFGGADKLLAILGALHGTVHLIPGNHDRVHPMHKDAHNEQHRWMRPGGFSSVNERLFRQIGDRRVMLSHLPYTGDHTPVDRYREFRPADRGLPVVHGHLHCKEKVTGPRQIHVGVDAWDLRPVHVDEVAKILSTMPL